jgi:alginate O-acetyltransferase complex protein AlgJ
MRNMKPPSHFSRVRDVVFSIVFFTILIIPAFTKLPPPSDFNKPSGKFLSSHPVLNQYWKLIQLPGAYQTYFSEHFSYRDRGLEIYNEIQYRFLGSNVYQNVLIGKEGWLYLTDEDNLRYFQCDQPFSPGELDTLVKNVKEMHKFSKENGAEFVFLIAPNKESIYPEFLPDGIGKSGKSCRMDQVLQALQKSGLETLDLRKTLAAEKTSDQLYYKTDTHWNDTGAFLAYRAVLSELINVFPSLQIWSSAEFLPVNRSRGGDLSKLIPLLDPIFEETVILEPIRDRKAVIAQGVDNQTILSETGVKSYPDAVVFRDSFFMGLLPFFAENFNQSLYRWSFDFDKNLILSEKPDIVIYEIAERYLNMLAH